MFYDRIIKLNYEAEQKSECHFDERSVKLKT